MTAYGRLFARLVTRPLLRERARSLLTLIAVALGVGVVIAIDTAGQSAAGSFENSIDSLSPNSAFQITETGGIREQLLGQLATLSYPFTFTPRVEEFAFLNGQGEAIPFIGVDMVAASKAQGTTADMFSLTSDLAPIWAGSGLGLRPGETVRLLINDKLLTYRVAGLLPSPANQTSPQQVIITDIGIAQRVAGRAGLLDSISVALPKQESTEHWRKILRQHLPASAELQPQGTHTEENQKMLAAFRWNLQVLSYIALLVGAFLIYNTISISVVRRRSEIGVLRALGASRSLILCGFFGEALFLAVAGSALGVLLGRAMAVAAVALVGRTVDSLYVTSRPEPIQLTISAVAHGVLVGLAVALLAAIAPAFEAARVTPVEAMARGRKEYVVSRRSRWTIYWALGMLACAALFCRLPAVDRQPIFAYGAVLLLVAGTSTLIPNVVMSLAQFGRGVIARMMGVETILAVRSLRGAVGRTSVLISALATAVAMTVAVGIMVGSFRQTVSLWMNGELKADFYLRPAGPPGADRHPTMSGEIADRIEQQAGVAGVDRFRAYPITYDGVPATLAGGESSKVRSSASLRFLPGEDRDRILAKLPTGDFAIVSEPFANKHQVSTGSLLKIPLAGAVHPFRVLGVYYDYSTERGFVILDRGTLLKYLPDRALSNLAVYLKPGSDPDAVHREIDQAVSGRAVLVFSNRQLRQGALAVFDQTFRITYALEAVAVFVAVMGIAGALLALVIDRKREFALLRFVGGSKQQVRRIILSEAGAIGLLSNVIGLVLGTVMSLILVFVINKQSFGWTIQFHWPVLMLFLMLSGIYLATLIAGLYPARVAVRMNPVEAIHEE